MCETNQKSNRRPKIDKDKWINAERQRTAKYFNVPISKTAPPNFPVNTLPVQRALAALSVSHPESVESAAALFYENVWVHWNDPMKPENMAAILRTILGSDEEARKVMESTKSDVVKKTLTENTNQAFRDGAFGLPWFVGECPLSLRVFGVQCCTSCTSCYQVEHTMSGAILLTLPYSDKYQGRDSRILWRRSHRPSV